MRVPPSKASTKGVPPVWKVKIYYGTDNLKTKIRQLEGYIFFLRVKIKKNFVPPLSLLLLAAFTLSFTQEYT
jgi:hypothetical protein